MKPNNHIRFVVLAILPIFFMPVLQAQGLQLTPGIKWVMKGSPTLVINNASLINEGSFIADSGTVFFTGDRAASGTFIGGANPISFYNLTIGKSANDLQLNNNAFVKGMITLDSGNLQLNDYLLDLGSTGSIARERDDARIIGVRGGAIRITALLNRPQVINPGNIGVEITSEGNLGYTVITRGHVLQTNADGESGIQRWFDIIPENNTNIPTTLRLFYLNSELAGKDKNALTVFSSKEGDNHWSLWGKDASDPVTNWVLKSNHGQLGRFILAIGSRNAFAKSSKTITAMQVYPSPAHNAFALQIISEEAGNGIMSLYDQSGHLLEVKRGFWQAGVTTINWNISKYAAGIFYLSTGNPNGRTLTVVKQ